MLKTYTAEELAQEIAKRQVLVTNMYRAIDETNKDGIERGFHVLPNWKTTGMVMGIRDNGKGAYASLGRVASSITSFHTHPDNDFNWSLDDAVTMVRYGENAMTIGANTSKGNRRFAIRIYTPGEGYEQFQRLVGNLNEDRQQEFADKRYEFRNNDKKSTKLLKDYSDIMDAERILAAYVYQMRLYKNLFVSKELSLSEIPSAA